MRHPPARPGSYRRQLRRDSGRDGDIVVWLREVGGLGRVEGGLVKDGRRGGRGGLSPVGVSLCSSLTQKT